MRSGIKIAATDEHMKIEVVAIQKPKKWITTQQAKFT